MFNLHSGWEYRNIHEMLSVEDGATHTPLHRESTQWAEKDGDEGEWGATKVQKVTCCGLHDHGTERSG